MLLLLLLLCCQEASTHPVLPPQAGAGGGLQLCTQKEDAAAGTRLPRAAVHAVQLLHGW